MTEEDKGFPPDIMDQLFPDRNELHACADKLNEAAGFSYFTPVEIGAHRLFQAHVLNFFTYQEKSKRTMNMSLPHKDKLNNYVFGLVGEVGETVDLLKKFFFHGHEVDSERLKSELGDILWYVSAVASLFGLNLQEIAQGNIEKLEKRYPEGFSAEASVKREKEGD